MDKNTKRLAVLGLLIALIFVSNYISIPIPTGFGITRVHVANGFCILAAMLTGPWWGGLAAGVGSMFYDFTNPAFISGAPFTFIFKFMMAAVAGLIAYSGGMKSTDTKKNIIGSIVGALTYVFLYLSKSYIEQRFITGIPHDAVIVTVITKAGASLANAFIAVVIAMILTPILRPLVKDKIS